MDEYVPTTEDVEDDYATGIHSINPGFTVETARSWFRKWLAAHDVEQKAAAWDESVEASRIHFSTDDTIMGVSWPRNPYRVETEEIR